MSECGEHNSTYKPYLFWDFSSEAEKVSDKQLEAAKKLQAKFQAERDFVKGQMRVFDE